MAMPIKASALAREPLYQQVCDLLTRQIASGVWKPNAALPNELDLARELGVSGGTVRKALEKLEAGRLVMRRQGRGTFVIDQATPEAASRFDRLRQANGDPIAWRAKLLQQAIGEPTPREQATLRIGPGEPVARKRRLLSVASGPFAVEEACLAVSRLPGLVAETLGDWNALALAQPHGVHVNAASEEVRPVPASPEVAAQLCVEAGTMLLRLDRVLFAGEETPIEWRILTCRMRDEYYLAEVN
jgi:GntR family transcriptional regulator